MSQEIKILIWCDNHGDERVPAEKTAIIHPVTGKPVEIDLCDPCRGEIDVIIAPVVALLEKVKPSPRPKGGNKVAPDGKKYPCPLAPDCGAKPLVFRSMVQHVRQAHKDVYEKWKADQDRIRSGQDQLPEAV